MKKRIHSATLTFAKMPSLKWIGILGLMLLVLMSACRSPIRDPSTLGEVEAEAHVLMMTNSKWSYLTVPESKWPSAIASLGPESVTVSEDGVDILIQPYFDGGWGYFIPSNDQVTLEPKGRFSDVGQGIYWYHPY